MRLFQAFTKIILLTGLSVWLIACGGGSGGGGISSVSISDLEYLPKDAYLNDGDGSRIVNGEINFNAPDGNVASYLLTVFDSNGTIVSSLSNPIPGVAGVTSGSLSLSLIVNTTVAGNYSVEIYLIDSGNNASNTLTGIFRIFAPIKTTSKIPDTGVDKCYDETAVINCPISQGDPFYGQDYQYSSNPMNFTNNMDGTITDNVTSLMWQMDQDGLVFNWYKATGTFNAVNNPGTANICGELTFAGYTDWRLPEKRELLSIVDYGKINPAIDTVYFPNTGVFNYWSNTAINSTNAWYGKFVDGSIKSGDKTTGMHLRCVRGVVWGGNSFIGNGDGTVTDTDSGLMWQKAGQGSSHEWEEMLGICAGLNLAGHTDWRLADIKELESIVGAEASLDIQPGIYCSSSTIDDENDSAWVIQFSPSADYGEVFRHFDGHSKQACSSFLSRCVR